MMVLPVCRPHVEDIKKQLVAEPTKLVTTVPCLISPTSVSSKLDFQAISVKQYQLYTLWGNHIRTACKDLLKGDQLQDSQKTINVVCTVIYQPQKHDELEIDTIFNLRLCHWV